MTLGIWTILGKKKGTSTLLSADHIPFFLKNPDIQLSFMSVRSFILMLSTLKIQRYWL